MKLRPVSRLVASLLLVGPLLPAADYTLKVTPQTIAWGYYWSAAKPVLSIKSGDTVEIQTVSGNPERLEQAACRRTNSRRRDVLEVRIRETRMDVPYAYNTFRKGSGLAR